MDIYVGNLPYDAMDGDLQELFEQYGKVTSARVVIDKMSGRSKGFGFVAMSEKAEADKAIEAINGQDFMGRPLRVNESQPRPRTDDRSGGGGGRKRW
ncbi:MAG: RNA-binding protein [Kiritimatiellae bacterium]|nr:RNA-binding protein [Kiritimatiellia bacterium]MDD4737028.1 RNA-binding protein [Kiritimatiellia bacterium]